MRALEFTCDDLRLLWSRSNLDASRRKFGAVCPSNSSQCKLRDVNSNNLANEIQNMCASKWGFCDLRVIAMKLGNPFGHPTQVSTQVQLEFTCDYLRVRLARAYISREYNLGFK